MRKLFSIFFLTLCFFSVKSQETDISTQFSIPDYFKNGYYGWACGITGEDPQLRTEAEELFLSKNTKSIDSWLFSDNPVQNIYALELLLRLERIGVYMNDSQKKQILVINESGKTITMCSGCTTYPLPIKEVIESLFNKYD